MVVTSIVDSELKVLALEEEMTSASRLNELIVKLFTNTISPPEQEWLEKKMSLYSSQITPLSMYVLKKSLKKDHVILKMSGAWLASAGILVSRQENLQNMHKVILSLMESSGYKMQSMRRGCCFGIAMMAMRAVMAGEMERFNERIRKLIEIAHHHDLKELMENIKAKDSSFYYECLAFFDGIQLLQAPYQYSYMMPEDKKVLSQQFSSDYHELLRGEGKHFRKLVSLKSFSGSYKQDDLQKVFENIRQAAGNKTLGVSLGLEGHRVFAAYDPQKHEWLFVDANYLPIHKVRSEAALVNMIIASDRLIRWKTQSLEFFIELDITVIARADDEVERMQKVLDDRMNYDKSRCLGSGKEQISQARFMNMIRLKEVKDLEKALEDNLININESKDGRTGLIIAVLTGAIKIAHLLLEHGADPKISEPLGHNALMLAAQKGHIEILQDLLKRDASYIDQKNQQGWTALMLAVRYGHLDVVKLLLDYQADMNVKNAAGTQALHIALNSKQLEIAEFLQQYASKKTNVKVLKK